MLGNGPEWGVFLYRTLLTYVFSFYLRPGDRPPEPLLGTDSSPFNGKAMPSAPGSLHPTCEGPENRLAGGWTKGRGLREDRRGERMEVLEHGGNYAVITRVYVAFYTMYYCTMHCLCVVYYASESSYLLPS